MKVFYVILFGCFSSSLMAQYFQLDADATAVDTSNCISDPSVEIYAFKDWELYQTVDDLWDGVIDSTTCLSLKTRQVGAIISYGIDFSSMLADKPLFMRYKTESLSNPLDLDNNSLATIYGGIINPLDIELNFGSQCPDNICSGIITVLNVEDNGNIYERVNSFQFSDLNNCNVSECFVTEKSNNTLKEAIYKFTLADNANTDQAITPSAIHYEKAYEFDLLENEVLISESYNTGSSYDIDLNAVANSWSGIALALHTEPGLPTGSNPSFIDIGLEQANASPQTINLNITEWESLYFQSNTNLRGGLVEGSTTDRHPLNIINNSEGLCLFVIELTFGGSSNFVQQGGNLHFSQHNSCMQFRNGSELIIDSNHHLNYGDKGTGMLFIRSGSSIVFGDKASLNFNGKLIFDQFAEYRGDKDIDIYLPEGSSWVFGPEAKIKKLNAEQEINIHMMGGELELSQLSLEDQAKLNLIYPSTDQEILEAKIYPNPTSDHLNFNFSKPLKEDMAIKITDLSGRTIVQIHLNAGITSKEVEVDKYPSGVYLVQCSSAEINQIRKLIIRQ